MKIYTRTGDDGTTGLIGGTRIKKNNIRLEAYGTVDELNSYIGVVRSLYNESHAASVLEIIQDRLFVIGAHLATEGNDEMIKKQVPVELTDILLLENEMDRMIDVLPPLNNFILPGGTQATAFCHVARTVCRRAERRIIELSEKTTQEPNLIKYINRLSDYLFVLSRKISMDLKAPEIVWSPDPKELII
ncbi:MAG TPA: cob(I)yrinic acid a,c-diamide adenosyltransferase [Prolixibacteraceae bacterium]|jgi:cob(I)alamin adenosyltransferase